MSEKGINSRFEKKSAPKTGAPEQEVNSAPSYFEWAENSGKEKPPVINPADPVDDAPVLSYFEWAEKKANEKVSAHEPLDTKEKEIEYRSLADYGVPSPDKHFKEYDEAREEAQRARETHDPEALEIALGKVDAFFSKSRLAEERMQAWGEQPIIQQMNGKENEVPLSEMEEQTASTFPEETPGESRSKLRSLVERFSGFTGNIKEKFETSKEYLTNRSKQIDAEAGEQGKLEKLFRTLGEEYNKRSWKEKLAIGASLGVGAAAFTSVSTPLALLFTGGLAAQRVAGMAGRFLKAEKKLQDTESGLFAKKEKAMMKAMLYTLGMGAAIKEGVSLASESAWGESVHEWLRHHYPFGHAGSPAAAPTPAHRAEIAHARVAPVETQTAPAPEVPVMPLVVAEHGLGFEHMMKNLGVQLREMVAEGKLDPAKYPHGSDLRMLAEADDKSIDSVIHKIAILKPDAFNADGTSAHIDINAHMTIDEHGQLQIDNPVKIPEAAPVVDALHTSEAPAAPESAAPAPEASPPDSSSAPDTGSTSAETSADATVPPPEASHTVDVESSYTPEVSGEIIHNPFGLEIPKGEAHIYGLSREAKHAFIYGGSLEDKKRMVLQYLTDHPKNMVYEPDTNAINSKEGYRIPWGYVDPKRPEFGVRKFSPIRTSRVLGAFSPWRGVSGPESFKVRIK